MDFLSVGNLQLLKMIGTNAPIEDYKLTFRSAPAVALAKSGGRADILHSLHYNDSFLSIKIATLKTVRSGLIMPIM